MKKLRIVSKGLVFVFIIALITTEVNAQIGAGIAFTSNNVSNKLKHAEIFKKTDASKLNWDFLTPVFTNEELLTINALLGENGDYWRRSKAKENHQVLRLLTEKKGKSKVRSFLLSDEPTPNEVKAKYVFFLQRKKGKSLEILDKREFYNFRMLLNEQSKIITDDILRGNMQKIGTNYFLKTNQQAFQRAGFFEIKKL